MHCPYLPDRIEQQLFHELGGPDAQATFEHLSRSGFRRSHHIVYRPACRGCNACVPVRIRVADFQDCRAFRKIRNRNADLRVENTGPAASEEQYHLFRRYVRARHSDGDMAHMGYRDYANLVVASPVDTILFEWRDEAARLRAACITDRMEDGYSAVYSFFDPVEQRRSLGTQVILSLVDRAAAEGRPYVYLGFWVPDSPKMDYKARFRPLEGFSSTGWAEIANMETPEEYG